MYTSKPIPIILYKLHIDCDDDTPLEHLAQVLVLGRLII